MKLDHLTADVDFVDACPGSVTVTHEATTDDLGHRVGFFHARAVEQAMLGLRSIAALHTTDYDWFFPSCTHCQTSWPCATMKAGFPYRWPDTK